MISKDFNPSLRHPLYFIRKGLLNGIKKYSAELGGLLMDFGSGSKPYKSLFSAEKYIGVDYSSEGHPHDDEAIDVFYDGKTIPFPDNYFDSVFSSEVFEHVFNLEAIIPEIARVMKPGGKILITCPFVWNEHEVPVDYARYTQFALKHLLEKNGFNLTVVDKSGNFITAISQLIVLYNDTHLIPKFGVLNKVPVVSSLIRFVFIFITNTMGLLLSKILPTPQDIYLNNIILAIKK